MFSQTCVGSDFYFHKRTPSLFRFKGKPPSLICPSVVYRYRCPGCYASYYGKIARNLVVRFREHLGINKASQKIKSSRSPIWDHKSGHDTSLENFEIISRTGNNKGRFCKTVASVAFIDT